MRIRSLALGSVVTLATMLSVVPAVSAQESPPTEPTVPLPANAVTIADGLRNPRQMDFGNSGELWVAEAGTGKLNASDQSGGCMTGPEGDEVCAGNTGSLTRVSGAATASPSTTRVADGLLSIAGVDGTGAVGLDAVSLGPTSISGIMTWVPPDSPFPASVAAQNGKLLDFSSAGVTTVADIGSFSIANPLPGHEPDSDPYGVLARAGSVFVADAANNTLLQVQNGTITTLATFEFTPQDEFDGVPTSIAWHNGNLYVGQLSSFVPDAAKVTVFDLSGNVVRTIDGLTSVTAVAVADNGDVYATEIFTGEPFASPGALVKIPADGSARTTTPLPTPGGVTLDHSGNVYVAINSVLPTDGAIIRMPA